MTRHRIVNAGLTLAVLLVGSASSASHSAGQQAPTERAPARSTRLDIQIPRPVATGDGDYLGWIGGASGSEAGLITVWVSLLASRDSAWIAELFDPLNERAADYAERFSDSQQFGEMAAFLEPVMAARAQKVEELFSRERELLRTVFADASSDEASRDPLIEQVMLARRADAFVPSGMLARPQAANILRLLHAASCHPVTPPGASAAMRQIAMDHASRVLEQRRAVAEAVARSGHRGSAAMDRAMAAGESPVGSMASVFRPIALGVARSAAMNREIAALAQAELPAEVGLKIVDELERTSYGPLAEDFFAFEAIELLTLPLVPKSERESAVQVIQEDRRARIEDRNRMLRVFEAEERKYVERGLVRDTEGTERFCTALLAYLEASQKRANQTVARLAELARTNPGWQQEAFDKEKALWLSAVEQRVQDMARSGAASTVVPYTRMGSLLGGKVQRDVQHLMDRLQHRTEER